MATKKDLLDAQKFNRTRLLSGFLGGAPGGKELAPANPLRAVYGSIALTAMVVIVGIFIGFFKPALPSGWENNKLIVAKDTGARYVSIDSVLYPVINTVSARLLIPPGEFSVISVNQEVLSGIPIGDTVGILGGPDALPGADHVDGRNWVACTGPKHTEVWLGGEPTGPATARSARLVEHDDALFVVADGKSFQIPQHSPAAVLRAIGLSEATPTPVTAEWLALFEPADAFDPLRIPGAGDPVEATTHPAGTVFHPIGSPADELFVLTADGHLSALSPLAYRLYQLGTGSEDFAQVVEASPAELADLPSAPRTAGIGWPEEPLVPADESHQPCAVLAGDDDALHTALAGPHEYVLEVLEPDQAVVSHIPESSGAIVRAGQSGTMSLIDPLGISYAVPGAVSESLERFGYDDSLLTVVPPPWLSLFPAGPALTVEAAGASPGAP